MRDYIPTANEFLTILNQLGIPHAVVGGVAAGIWSEERVTKDVDFTIAMDESQWIRLQEALKNQPETEVFQTSFDTGEKVPFLIRLRYKGVIIDLLTSLTPYQDLLIKRRITKEVWGYTIDVASTEDVILLKLLAHRGQDMVDIQKMLQHIKNLDLAYIEKWVKEWEVAEYWEQVKSG